MFVGVWFRFRKSSPMREEIKEIEEIAQRSEVEGSENNIEVGPDRARSTGGQSPVNRPVDRCARRAQT